MKNKGGSLFEIIIPEEDLPEGDNENISTIYLKPKRGSYEGESTHWSFYVGSDKKEIITATVKDEVFLAKIFDGSIRPHHTDLLKVKLRTTQKIKGQDIKTKHEVMKVLERIEAPTQHSF